MLQLINLYRVRGHLIAHLDPLGDHALYHPELDPATFGLTLWDLDREFVTGGLGGLESGTLRQILDILHQTYCQTVGIEYRHIQDAKEKDWILERIEPPETRAPLDPETRKLTLRRLVEAEDFERYLHTRFVGHKRFGLEGAETTIPVLAKVLAEAANAGVAEAVIGMAHRGRLNVLANIIGKALPKILSEFEENTDPMITQGSGDVKYHLGSAGPFRSSEGNEILVSVMLESEPPGMGQSGGRRDRARQAGPARRRAEGAGHPDPDPRRRAHSPAREWSGRRSTSRSCTATGRAARSTSSSTTRSGSPRRPKGRALPSTRRISRGRFRRPSST